MGGNNRLFTYFVVVLSNFAITVHATNTETDTLRLVHLLYRHGDRSPAHSYPGNPVKESDWPQGFGQLTQIGIQQSYFLGNLLRKRYLKTGFMKLSYEASEIYVRSTDKDRTLMTAYSVLAGLYPPNGTQVWNKQLPWQPIPVHTVPLVDDYLLRDDAPCPKFDRLVKEFRKNSKELKEFIFKNQDLIKLIHIKTGMPADPLSLFRVLDPVHCERIHEKDFNLTLADWVKNDTIAGRLLEARNFVSKIRFATPEIARLRADCPDINCPLESFKSLMKDMMPVDIKQECELESNVPTKTVDKSSHLVIGIAVLACLAGVLLITLIAVTVIFRKQDRHVYTYRPLPIDTI
ncbi:hypothetical protein KUTeg_008296 [Tegillarca granosa]|uniref:acid phosphatase n=1 Tax=Tegillarca granosa TaxID=220873 RepID=A0ABQ9FBW0_TEGGR|nr:hypothetical protein KUTeg_008296 [Tegillarca granosa]